MKEIAEPRRAGRPTNYTDDMAEKAKYYLENFDSEEIDDSIPSIAGLADYLDKARSTMYEWANNPECKVFSDTLDRILGKQERVALNKGIKGEFNSSITKLVLHNHGYKDSKKIDRFF